MRIVRSKYGSPLLTRTSKQSSFLAVGGATRVDSTMIEVIATSPSGSTARCKSLQAKETMPAQDLV